MRTKLILRFSLVVGVLLVVVLAAGVALPLKQQPMAQAQTCRNAIQWPFAQNSIWNMPIGSNAQYVHAGIGAPQAMGVTVDEDILILEPGAPLKKVAYNNAGWDPGKTRCGSIVSGQYLWGGLQVPVPNDFSTDPGYLGSTPNMSGGILMPDGVTLKQTQPLHVCGAGGTVTSQYEFPDDNIKTGDGIQGAHGGSGMSSMGGTLRVGELVPGGVIRHALKINLYARKYLAYNNDGTRGYRWPAPRADSYAGDPNSPCRYGGTVSALEMGALLALKPDFNINNLRTEPARILAQAFKDYGAYVVDDTCWDVFGITTEWGPDGRVISEFQSVWGWPFETSKLSTCTDTSNECKWAKDWADILTNLHVVNNNSASSIGGGGTPRQPLAPPFCDGSPTATPTATPAGLPSPWQTQDIGAVAATGSASYSNGVFTVKGSGADIWDTADEFRFVYQTLNGDGQIVARVTGVQNTNAWAKAGVMIRETLNANSKHAMMVLTPGNGLAFQRRTSTGGSSYHTSGGSASAPYWVKLVRSGNTFTAYKSSDGTNWTQVGSETISMAASVYVGLAVTSHNDGTLCTATLDNVSVGGGASPTPTPTPTNTPTPTPTPTNTPTPTPTPSGQPTTYEAESSSNTLTGRAAVASCSNCSGGQKVGYVGNGDGQGEGTLQFNGINVASSGSYQITIYYLNGDSGNRTAQMSVNGGAATNVSFPSTGSWPNPNVGSVNVTVNLNAGNNTLKFSNPSAWAPDFDRITVPGGASPTPTPTNTPTPATYSEDFNDGQAQSWTLSNASVSSQQLVLNNWGGASSGVYDGQTFSANYTYGVDVTTVAGDNANKLRILFNYSNSSNYYYVEVGGGTSNTVTLNKKVGGSVTTLATYGSAYPIKDVWVRFTITYSSGGYITVKATKNGVMTTLFNNVQDSSLTSGKIGVEGQWMVANVDNVVVNY